VTGSTSKKVSSSDFATAGEFKNVATGKLCGKKLRIARTFRSQQAYF
jgi:hypothetical protein